MLGGGGVMLAEKLASALPLGAYSLSIGLPRGSEPPVSEGERGG